MYKNFKAGAKLSLAHFIREHPVKRLAKTEVRYYLEKGQVDDELFGRGQLRRAAIFDKATKQTRLEIVRASSFHWDEPHKMWDNDRLATGALR
ncbi:unnamed protein product [Symbiodinium sp. KB8]|nr:unnamed protein product [Symbiodinium sp. KB8]